MNEWVSHILGDSAHVWHIKNSPQKKKKEDESMNFEVKPNGTQILALLAMHPWVN